METWIALLKGINVGGHRRMPMQSLAAIFEQAACRNVATYIQSGNVVFSADLDSVEPFIARIGDAIAAEYEFRPVLHLISATTLETVIAANPYPDATSTPKSLHVFFLAEQPAAKIVEYAGQFLAPTESISLGTRALYLHAPDGVARSKFAGRADAILKTATTARNWRTVTQLASMAKERRGEVC